MAKALRAEVPRPAELDAGLVDVEALEPALGEPRVVVVALVLHARIERDHREVVRVGDGVDVAREAQGERRERHDLREAAARRGALDVEGRTARGLAHAADHLLPEAAEALDKTEGRRRLALAERRRGDGRDIDVLAAAAFADALEHLRHVDLGQNVAVGRPFVFLQAQFGREIGSLAEIVFGSLGDLPVLHLGGIKFHAPYYIKNKG